MRSYVCICGSSEIGSPLTALTLRAKLKLYMGQFRPGGALSGTAEINVLQRLGAHVEILLPFGTAGGQAWILSRGLLGRRVCMLSGFHPNILISFTVQKHAAQVCRGLVTVNASVRVTMKYSPDLLQVFTHVLCNPCWDRYQWPWIGISEYRKSSGCSLNS